MFLDGIVAQWATIDGALFLQIDFRRAKLMALARASPHLYAPIIAVLRETCHVAGPWLLLANDPLDDEHHDTECPRVFTVFHCEDDPPAIARPALGHFRSAEMLQRLRLPEPEDWDDSDDSDDLGDLGDSDHPHNSDNSDNLDLDDLHDVNDADDVKDTGDLGDGVANFDEPPKGREEAKKSDEIEGHCWRMLAGIGVVIRGHASFSMPCMDVLALPMKRPWT
ncbi:hypothetical protein AMAG_06792 [Allomyces macrogynus ATCC 38327]|uniref:Uncharacterized protein n=1 Tax=Allomyces macrogynus (strain ATCC 38327) TaxID=578462 RepID=A0A0L0SEW1_ALLM3|nr:hypothetical protein AMAG_06792 [Allomyces macrogynus ATCC 38327]|eukprot:KNE61036.1 hypothetical protein AMAG_06792 [Allomyces macrogynus ATCC 38327]